MPELQENLFRDIVILFLAAFLGGLTARALRAPILFGYLAAGMIVGPHVLRLVGEIEAVRSLAELGVILLLFAVGIEISIREMLRLGRAVIIVGIGQVAGTMGLGFAIGSFLGWDPSAALLLGMVLALSSTMVVLKALSDRGELGSLHGQVLTGIMVLQDLAFVPMAAILPALAGDRGVALAAGLGFGLLKAAGLIAAIFLLGGRLLPWVLRQVALLGSREAFIISVVAITLASAALTLSMGLSAAMGAFLAGLVLSESVFGRRALAEVVPLRDTFSALFFVSLGMLTDPAYLVDHWSIVLAIVSATVVTKFALTAALLRMVGFLPNTALLVGFSMLQVGEFSFILASLAVTLGIVGDNFLSLTILTAVVTMAATPGAVAGGSRLVRRLGRKVRLLRPYLPGRAHAVGSSSRTPKLLGHVVIAGLGRVGSLIAQALHYRGITFIGIDLDPRTVEFYRQQGHYVVHGDSSNPVVLDAAQVSTATALVVTADDVMSVELTVQHGLQLNPNIDVVARVRLASGGGVAATVGRCGGSVARDGGWLGNAPSHPAQVRLLE